MAFFFFNQTLKKFQFHSALSSGSQAAYFHSDCRLLVYIAVLELGIRVGDTNKEGQRLSFYQDC